MAMAIRIIATWVFCLIAASAAAATDRVALVLGLGAYRTIEPLENTRNDARAIADTLKGIGFDVTLSLDATGDQLRQLLKDFAFRSETADLALIYFAGHGVEVQGENFLIPVDAEIRNNLDVQRQSISLKQLLATVERARKMRIVILDSCRDNPLGDTIDLTQSLAGNGRVGPQSTRGGGGLAAAKPDRGTLVAFAARDGQVALDGTGQNSPYARALMDKMVKPGLEISLMFRQVRDMVLQETKNLQEPHTYGSLTGIPFYLAGAADGQIDISGSIGQAAWAAIRPDQEEQLLALADLGDTRSMLGLAYIRLNPSEGRFDPTEAVSFLERASAAGSPEAQFELAKIYERGTGVPPDPARALELYQSAAGQDYADAINDLGFLYYQGGLGLTPDPLKALELFERAADLRHPQAQFNFAALIDDGLIDSKGPGDAARYLYAALRSGSSDVLDLLTTRPAMFSRQTRRALQSQLKKYEFYAGAIDGEFGPGTQKAIRLAYGLTE
ncbi:caspase family protein [Sedimentitalea sp. HM32M-2]|uniref:caspase family protein n=1 Tax=Sedimentitalea sp. HM32M-2 TaxID=3351566 RepID=UPI00363AC1D2